MSAKIACLLVIVGHLFLYGCATAKGPLFKEVPLGEHKGKAIVYFYRNSHAAGGHTYDLRINGGNTLILENKGYHLFILDPGAYNFTVFYKSELKKAENTFTLQGNRVYYIRFHADVVGYNPGPFTSNPIVRYGKRGDTSPISITAITTSHIRRLTSGRSHLTAVQSGVGPRQVLDYPDVTSQK